MTIPFAQFVDETASTLGYTLDAAQRDAVEQLSNLARQLGDKSDTVGFISRIFRKKSAPRGMYIWGGVGRGKTFLMDLFFEHVVFEKKRRIHFHRFMQEVHQRLAILQGRENPLVIVGKEIAETSKLLCLDEFHVSDIGDAMIMRNLLESLMDHDVTIITTANWVPDRLYEHGLQRAQFLPTIDLIKTKLDVLNLDAGKDYRLASLERSGVFYVGQAEETREKMETLFSSISPVASKASSMVINNRNVDYQKLSESVIWFEFSSICDGPRGKDDYISLSKEFHTVFISDVPLFDTQNDNARRRFTWLVDEFYDRRVKLILSSPCYLEDMFCGALGGPERDRTESRLIEMQTKRYLGEPHSP